MKNTTAIRMLAMAVLALMVLVLPVSAFNMNSTSTKNCAGTSCAQPATYSINWGTTAGMPGTIAERNLTFFFNMSSYLGHQISNLRVERIFASGAGWTGNGNAMPITGILGFGPNYQFQPFGSIGGINSATNSTSGLNYFSPPSSYVVTPVYVDFNSTYLVADNVLAVSFAGFYTGLPSNWWCVGIYCAAGYNNTKYFGNLTFTDNGVFGNFTLPNITESYWPIDNEKSSTFNEANAMTFLTKTRGGIAGEGNYVVVKSGGITRATKGFENGNTWLAFTFNSSISQYPTSTRVFMQVNELFLASDMMGTYKQVGVGGGWYDRYMRTHFFANFRWIDYGIFNYQEVTTDAAAGTHPFFCWIFRNRVPFQPTETEDFKAICSAPNGTANANDRVVLKETVSGNFVAQLSNATGTDKSKSTELTLDGSLLYNVVYVTTARGNITETLSYPYPLGTAYATTSQGRSNNNAVQVSFINSEDKFSNTSGGSAKIVQLKASDYSQVISSTLTGVLGQYSFPLGVSPSERTAYFISVQHMLPAPFSVTTDMQMGTIHLFYPSAEQMTVSVSCDSPVQFLSGQPRSVTCDTTYNPDVTMVGDLLNPVKTVASVDTNIYKFSETTTGNIASVAVTDYYSGTVIPAQMRGSKLILQNMVVNGAVGFSKLASFNGRFTDTFGTVSVSHFSFTANVVDRLTDVNEVVNHRALFLSYLDNATGTYNLPGAIANISGQLCTTSLKARNVNDTVATCSLMMPNSLYPVPTSYSILYNGTYLNISLNQSYWGFYDTDEWSDLGIAKNGYGSVYLLSYDANQGRAFEKFDIGTCNEPEVSQESVNQNDMCKPTGCPTSNTIMVVDSVSVNPVQYTCYSEGQSTCTVDSISQKAYVASCGTLCGLTTRLCSTAACNSDSSACSGEPTIQEIEDETGLTGLFVANPLMKFIFVDNMTFFIGLILIIAISVYIAVNVSGMMAGIIGGFLLLGLIVIALPGGFLILLLVTVIVVVYLGYQAYAGITGMQIK